MSAPRLTGRAGAVLLASVTACAQAGPPGDSGPRQTHPSLIVLVVVDQLRPDYLERFAAQFTGGYATMLGEGAVFTLAHHDHAITSTAPGHATLLSGREPRSTGIVSNNQGVPDRNHPLLETQGPGASPWRFRGTTLADWLVARDTSTRIVSVSRKDRGAILPIGRSQQHVYWYSRGRFTTSDWYRDTLPAWVRDFNASRIPLIFADSTWNLLLPEGAYPEPDDQPWENQRENRVFPHTRQNLIPQNDRDFDITPALDQATVELALRGARALELGRGRRTDLLVVSLSATDGVGHAFGPFSREIHDQSLRVDRLLGALLDSLGRAVGAGRMVVALTSDHGVTEQPERAAAMGWPTGRYASDSLRAALQRRLIARFGPGRWIRFFENGLLVLEADTIRARGVNVEPEVVEFAAELRRLPGVLRVDTRATIAAADTVRDYLARRWLKAVPPDLPAALMITLREGWMFRSTTPSATHGHVWDSDAHVPLILMGPWVRPGRYGGRVSTADLGPTLARIAGVVPTEPVEGRVLTEALLP